MPFLILNLHQVHSSWFSKTAGSCSLDGWGGALRSVTVGVNFPDWGEELCRRKTHQLTVTVLGRRYSNPGHRWAALGCHPRVPWEATKGNGLVCSGLTLGGSGGLCLSLRPRWRSLAISQQEDTLRRKMHVGVQHPVCFSLRSFRRPQPLSHPGLGSRLSTPHSPASSWVKASRMSARPRYHPLLRELPNCASLPSGTSAFLQAAREWGKSPVSPFACNIFQPPI